MNKQGKKPPIQYPEWYMEAQVGATRLEEDGDLDGFSTIEAAFIISGANNRAELDRGINWFNQLIKDIEDKNIIEYEKMATAEKLFYYFPCYRTLFVN